MSSLAAPSPSNATATALQRPTESIATKEGDMREAG
ncbi:hypothetical protein Mhypo_01513 [Meiothermus hypogaeus]|uniref:Uncharacterized protein n=1 Tax=Meiothermus hypogaeus TaxID=884155 RepID=A0ABX9MNX2_9DEIN|nr:hypothetical protein Mhypo_01513 [Meiothermus hypogaeus]